MNKENSNNSNENVKGEFMDTKLIDDDENVRPVDDITNLQEIKNTKGKYLTGFVTGVCVAFITMMTSFLIYVFVFNGFEKFQNNSVGQLEVQNNKEVDSSIDGIISKIEYLTGVINTYYLDEVKTEDVVEGIYKGIFASLNDPYSEYYTPSEYKELVNKNNGQFAGIGVSIVEIGDGTLKVTSFLDGTKAIDAGMKVGDVIVKVDGEDIKGEKYGDVLSKIQGDEGTIVHITVNRVGEDNKTKEIDLEIERALVDTITVSSKMLEDKIGYIYIKAYEANTGKQFKENVEKLKEEGMVALIIDERYNGGGLLTSVTEIADYVMKSGNLVTIKDKSGKVTKEVNTTDKLLVDVPIVLLVNEKSASASEVMAGAFKDRQIGKIVGKKTFGKGIVQSLIPLKDGSAVKVTTERYYTPNGNYIHKEGIEPDIEVELDEQEGAKGIDTQLDKAIEVIKKEVN